MKRGLLIAGRVILGGIFLYAGYAKLREPWLQFAVSLDTWKILPETALEPFAKTLPWVEVVLGLATISGVLARWFSLIATALLTFFLGLGVWAYATGRQVDCGCFGSGGGQLDARWFTEHGLMVALGLGVTVGAFLIRPTSAAPQPDPAEQVKIGRL